jgi:hypothetical protein
LSSVLETIGLWLVGALKSELARLGDLGLGLLSWLVDVDRQALGALANPLVLWLVLLSLLMLRVLVNRPLRIHTRRPIRGVR